MSAGPLAGVRVVELAGLGALPYGSLRLADMGAEVIRVERIADVPDEPVAKPHSAWDRGRRSVAVDLKQVDGVETVLRLAETVDVFLEAFRPGVVERLGVGPDDVLARNPRIVYGRLTGWGQDGPLAQQAGHSLNYEAVTGVIHAIGRPEVPPSTALQVLGDFAGGGLTLAYGVVCALLDAQRTGRGQVVDAAMVDGVASLAAVFYSMAASGFHGPERGSNLFDGGAPFYAVYPCADGRSVSVAPIEPHFYALLLEGLDVAGEALPEQYDQARWPERRRSTAPTPAWPPSSTSRRPSPTPRWPSACSPTAAPRSPLCPAFPSPRVSRASRPVGRAVTRTRCWRRRGSPTARSRRCGSPASSAEPSSRPATRTGRPSPAGCRSNARRSRGRPHRGRSGPGAGRR